MSKNKYSLKKIFNSFKKTSNNIPERINGDQYFYIHEFEQADDKLCIHYDKRNEEIFQKNLKIYNNINKQLVNTPFNIDNKPNAPRRPNNYERLNLWRKRNVKISAHYQTLSILYLLANNIKIKTNDYCNGVEPYEAVNIAEKLSIEKNDNINNIINIYLNNPSNNINNPSNNINNPSNNLNNPSNNLNNPSNNLTCSNPEHHSVNHKIKHYETHADKYNIYPSIQFGFDNDQISYLNQNNILPSAPLVENNLLENENSINTTILLPPSYPDSNSSNYVHA